MSEGFVFSGRGASGLIDRLLKRLKPKGFKGNNFGETIENVMADSRLEVAQKTAGKAQAQWESVLKRIGLEPDTIRMPTTPDLILDEELYRVNALKRGKLVSKNLKEMISEDLRATLRDFLTSKPGEPTMLKRIGSKAGAMNPALVDAFHDRISRTFEGYTGRNPANIRAIAITETRSAVNEIKMDYMRKLVRHSMGKLNVVKVWIHNPRLSKQPRKNHAAVNRVERPLEHPFKVPDGYGGFTAMDRPHDPKAPAGQVINCNCDVVFRASASK